MTDTNSAVKPTPEGSKTENPEKMDEENPTANQPPKRKFQGADGKELESGKRNRVEGMTDEGKATAVQFAIILAETTCGQLGINLSALQELYPSVNLFTLAYRIHQYARGKLNVDKQSEKIRKIESNTQSIIVKGNTYTINAVDMMKVWTAAANKSGFDEKTYKDIFRNCHTVICYMQLFASRLKELQVGPDSWIIGKKENVITQAKTASYGIDPRYRHFLSGLAWDISLRGTLSRNTTSLCQLALLSKSHSDAYSERNVTTVNQTLGFIPQINDITSFVKANNAVTNKPIISSMADMIRLHGDCHKRKMSLPFSMIYNHCRVMENGKPILSSERLMEVGFSSKKAALLYNKSLSGTVPAGVDKEFARQVTFHAIFGTQGEDQGILQFMTNNKTWATRKEIGKEMFKLMNGNTDGGQKVDLIKLNYYSKSITSSQNQWMATSGEVTGANEVMSGMRIRKIEDDDLTYALNGGFVSASTMATSASEIVAYLEKLKKTLIAKIQEIKKKGGGITT